MRKWTTYSMTTLVYLVKISSVFNFLSQSQLSKNFRTTNKNIGIWGKIFGMVVRTALDVSKGTFWEKDFVRIFYLYFFPTFSEKILNCERETLEFERKIFGLWVRNFQDLSDWPLSEKFLEFGWKILGNVIKTAFNVTRWPFWGLQKKWTCSLRIGKLRRKRTTSHQLSERFTFHNILLRKILLRERFFSRNIS